MQNRHKQKAPLDARPKALVLFSNFGCGRALKSQLAFSFGALFADQKPNTNVAERVVSNRSLASNMMG